MEQALLDDLSKRSPISWMPIDDYFQKNFPPDKNPIDALMGLSSVLQAPLHFDGSNEIYFQLKKYRPHSLDLLLEGFQTKKIFPILTHAHHTHISLMSSEEIVSEIHTNQDLLYHSLNIPKPSKMALFSPECSYASSNINTYKKLDIDAIFVPDVVYRGHPFTYVDQKSPIHDFPFFITDTNNHKILALPLNANLSENIWKALMIGGVNTLGYKVNLYNSSKAVEYYKKEILEQLRQAPENGLLVYYSDFEFMGLAQYGLDLIGKVWAELLNESEFQINITSIEDYLSTVDSDTPSTIQLPDVSWAPAQSILIRFDGVHPTVHNDKEAIYHNHPFLLWAVGKPLSNLTQTILELTHQNTPITPQLDTQKIFDENILNLSTKEAIILHNLFIKRACNWGWVVTEDRARWGYIHAFYVIQNLIKSEVISINITPKLLSNLQEFQRINNFFLSASIQALKQTLESILNDSSIYVESHIWEDWNNFIFQAEQIFDKYSQILQTLQKEKTLTLSVLQEVFLDSAIIMDYLFKIFSSHPGFGEKLQDHKDGVLYHTKPSLYKLLEKDIKHLKN
jgi:hypothetical protein